MSSIDIQHPHALPAAQARQAVEEIAGKLQERFQVDCSWAGETLSFTRSGVDGKIELADQAVRVTAKLGFMAGMFKDAIEAEIKRVLQERF